MELTGPEMTSFFTNSLHMGINARTLQAIFDEGNTSIEDLEEFHSDDLDPMVENFKRPPQIPGPSVADVATATLVNQAPLQLPAKSLKHLKIEASAVRYYKSI